VTPTQTAAPWREAVPVLACAILGFVLTVVRTAMAGLWRCLWRGRRVGEGGRRVGEGE
jgi:hypothetical protein